MKPVSVMKFVANFGPGGTERQFVNLGLALDPSRFALQFGCLRLWGELLTEVEARGIPVRDYNVWTFRHPKALAAQLRLARDIRRHEIQIVHTYNFYANVFTIPPAKLAGARVVASIRDMGAYLSTTQRRLQKFVCGLADRVLVNANAIRDWLIADGYDADRITVIPNGIDLKRFEQPALTGSLHSEFGLPVNAPLVGVVGRVKPLKGIEDFLRAAAVVAPRFPNARFLIIGDGLIAQGRTISRDDAYRQELLNLIAQLGLRDRLVLTGSRTDVERILPQLSVSVLPSLTEGLSNSLLESMAAGLPVVATRVGDSSEAVEDGESGILVPPGDPDALADGICRLLGRPALAAHLGENARRSVTERYSMQRLAMTTSLFYESLLPSNLPPRSRAARWTRV